MENLNDPIWNPEDDSVSTYSIPDFGGTMLEVCTHDGGTAGSLYACSQDAPERTLACI